MLGSKWRPFQKKYYFYYSNVSRKMLKILEKSGKSQGMPSGTKCRNHVDGHRNLLGIMDRYQNRVA